MSTLKVTTVQTSAGGAVTLTKLNPAKAYVQFSDDDGTFDETFNTSSTTDNGNGDISYGLSSNMSNANFPASGEAGGDFSSFFSRIISHSGSTASTIRFRCTNNATHTTSQGFRMSSIIHGDLA
tara:strand:+ start:2201 stop:2572 length:372 start_codon:yes stop_codon:yes gene_type:complete